MVYPQLGRPELNHVLGRLRQLSGDRPGGQEEEEEGGVEGHGRGPWCEFAIHVDQSLVALKESQSWTVHLFRLVEGAM